MEQLNLNLLRALHALLSCANVTRAAARLSLTQSAMSRNLALLREHLGDPLLVREGVRYLLTDRAMRMLPKLQKLMADIEDLVGEETFDPARCKRSFVIASSDYVAQFIFPDIVDSVQRQAPRARLHYRMLEPSMMEELGRTPVDIVTTMVSEPPENLHGKPMGNDYPVCVMAENHPLAEKELTLEGLLRYPHVQVSGGGDKDSFLDRWLQQRKRSRNLAVTVPFFSSAFSILTRCPMLLIVPLHIAINARRHFPLTYKELPMEVPEHRYYVLWHAVHHNDPAHRWLREQIVSPLADSMYSPRQSI